MDLAEFYQDCQTGVGKHDPELALQLIFTFISVAGMIFVVYLLRQSCNKIVSIQSRDHEIKED